MEDLVIYRGKQAKCASTFWGKNVPVQFISPQGGSIEAVGLMGRDTLGSQMADGANEAEEVDEVDQANEAKGADKANGANEADGANEAR